MNHALLAAAHFVGAMVLFGCLLTEHMLASPELDQATARKLTRIDMIYGIVAAIQIATGVMRMYAEKGVAYYVANPYFHAKIGTFVLLGVASIYPSLCFRNWLRTAKQPGGIRVDAGVLRRVVMLIRVELLLIVIIPVLASLMARGA